MRVAIYARVSTPSSKTKGSGTDPDSPRQNPETQLQPMRTFCTSRGWEIAGEYIDRMSGAKDHRPELDRMMQDARRRSVDVVLVWKLDRFGRSLQHLINAMADLQAVGVAFVSMTDNLDLTTPSGRLMFAVIAAMAEFERELIKERVKAGLTRAKAAGKELGRPRRVFSRPEARKLQAQGLSLRKIGEALGVSHQTVKNALQPQP